MSDTIHHQADPPGVTWDLTVDGRRYLVIEEDPDSPRSDCGYPGSRDYSYGTLGCRCDTCRIARTEAVRRRRQAQRTRPRPQGRYRCNTCGDTFTAWATAQRHADTHHGARIKVTP